jgi:oxygen-independent coproporphyrinogen-3 oxidase
MILQLKTGRLEVDYFRSKFGRDLLQDFQSPFQDLRQRGFLTIGPEEITLTSDGLLQVDRLLPGFFLPEHRGARYT